MMSCGDMRCLIGQLKLHANACQGLQTNIMDIQEKISGLLEQLNVDIKTSIAGFKSQVDASVNNFLLQDKAKIITTLESAASSAASPDLLQIMLEKTVSGNLAGNQALMELVVGASLRNGILIDELRTEIVAALAGSGSKSTEAVKKLVSFATGPGASLEAQKELLVALEAEAVSKNRDVLNTARVWQRVFNTRDEVVQGTIATLIGASTGAADVDSKSVAAAAFSRSAFKAGGLLLSGYVSQGPLRTVFATARSDTRNIDEMKKSVSDVYGGGLRMQFDGDQLMPKGHSNLGNLRELNVLLGNVSDSKKSVRGKVRNAKKGVDESMATFVNARTIAGTAAQNARRKGAAAVGKAHSGSKGNY